MSPSFWETIHPSILTLKLPEFFIANDQSTMFQVFYKFIIPAIVCIKHFLLRIFHFNFVDTSSRFVR